MSEILWGTVHNAETGSRAETATAKDERPHVILCCTSTIIIHGRTDLGLRRESIESIDPNTNPFQPEIHFRDRSGIVTVNV
jgi:hypothetical protein